MRHAVSITALTALLIVGSALAAPPPRHASNPAAVPRSAATGAEAATELTPADRKRVDAIQQYQRDLVSVVALRADPGYLLGAAILAKPFENPVKGLDFAALSARAAAAPGTAPAAEWARMDLCTNARDCPNAKAVAYLEKHAADNAAVWIVAMDVAARDKDEKAEQAALAKAAAAQLYDDYYGKALAGVAKAVAVLPPRPETTRGAHAGQPNNADGVRVLVAVSSTQSHIRPQFDPLVQLCAAQTVEKHAATKADCLKVAHTLRWGSSPTARAVGLHIQGALDPARKSDTDQASRNLAWQVHQYSGLLQHALTDPSLASKWLARARNGGTELSLILATLRANRIPTEAPAGAAAAASVSN